MTNSVVLLHGDCRERMAEMEPESVDAIVCDPPYGLEFMGAEWDKLSHVQRYAKSGGNNSGFFNHSGHGRLGMEWKPGQSQEMQSWHQTWAEEAYRVLKPGGHLLAFSGTRTSHRMVCAIEDAGFEIRDSLSWLYGSGFPKSLDVSKAMDKAAGAEREVVGSYTVGGTAAKGAHKGRAAADADEGSAAGFTKDLDITSPATDLARQWQGWGTALKPAHEPICMARKPLVGTVAANVAEFGTGAINVDGCRIEAHGEQGAERNHNGAVYEGVADGYKRPNKSSYTHKTDWKMQPEGRWPANLILDEDAAAMLDQMSGVRAAGGYPARRNSEPGSGRTMGGGWHGEDSGVRVTTDTGGASRFFYCAKSSRRERNAGLGGPDRVTAANSHPT